MAAYKYKLVIDQGATFDDEIIWLVGSNKTTAVPVDLTGCIARAHIRSELESPDILLEMTTENGRIILNNPLGSIKFRVEAADTKLITWTAGVYDLEIQFPDGTVRRRLKGTVSVTREVTRE